MEGIGSNHGVFEIQRVEEGFDGGDFVGFIPDLELSEDGAFVMEDGAQQVGSFFLAVTGAAHSFAIDSDSLAGEEVLIGEPAAYFQVEVIGIQALEGASEGGFGGRVFACAAQGFKGVAREFLSPLSDGLETSST